MKVGMNFEKDFPFLDHVKHNYFKNREVKCSNCKDYLEGRCNGGKIDKLEITDCLIKKVICEVQESKCKGMPIYLCNKY